MRSKNDLHILGCHSLSKLRNKRKFIDERPRFYHKDYIKRFAKIKQEDLLDLTRNLNSNLNPDAPTLKRNYIQFSDNAKDVEEFLEDGEVADEESDVGKELWATSITIELNEIQTKTREFNAKLRENPSDEQLWLDYVSFQDIALGNTYFNVTGQEKAEKEHKKEKQTEKAGNVLLRNRAIIEKKLSILKTASEKNPRSILLAVERLKLSKEIYDNATLDRQWKELIFMFPGNVEVWKHYLCFAASHFTTFSVSKIARSYKNYFLKLKQMHGQGNQHFYEFSNSNFEQINGTQIENEMVSLLIRLANLWSRAGYREKTIALFQALVELNLFSPQFPGSYSLEDRLATFEPFWESGAPRFAEDDAVGWAMVARNRHSIGQNETSQCFSNPNNDEIEDKLVQEYLHAYKGCEERNAGDNDDEYDERSREPRLWLRLELERERRHWCPWRSRGKSCIISNSYVSSFDPRLWHTPHYSN